MVKPAPRYERKQPDARRGLLIEAAIRCLARDGLEGFTVDNVTKESKVSRGLINHHFGGMDELLRAVYADMTATLTTAGQTAALADGNAESRLVNILDTMCSPPLFSRTNLRAWLALWGKAAIDPRLRATHRDSYGGSRRAMAEAIDALAVERDVSLDSVRLATTVIALIDGLWIEWCLDPQVITRDGARQMVLEVLEAKLGRLA